MAGPQTPAKATNDDDDADDGDDDDDDDEDGDDDGTNDGRDDCGEQPDGVPKRKGPRVRAKAH